MNAAGRPALYAKNEVTLFAERVWQYFKKCDENKDIPRVTALCLHLGMTRQSLLRYSKKEGFCDIIAYAKLVIEDALVEEVLKNPKPRGAMFVLATSFNYLEKHGINLKSDMMSQEDTPLPEETAQIFAEALERELDD